MTSPNLRLTVGNEKILWNKVMKEVQKKRYAGPFDKIPFKNFIQSPIGLVPKDSGKDVRLIFHLSYLRKPNRENQTSLNANTAKEECTVNYTEFNTAVKLCLAAGINCNLGKSDMSSAFRNLVIKMAHWKYLIMMAKDPRDRKMYYFVDKCLPFGAAISCSHFQRFSNAVAHLVKLRTGKPLVNYLDD